MCVSFFIVFVVLFCLIDVIFLVEVFAKVRTSQASQHRLWWREWDMSDSYGWRDRNAWNCRTLDGDTVVSDSRKSSWNEELRHRCLKLSKKQSINTSFINFSVSHPFTTLHYLFQFIFLLHFLVYKVSTQIDDQRPNMQHVTKATIVTTRVYTDHSHTFHVLVPKICSHNVHKPCQAHW